MATIKAVIGQNGIVTLPQDVLTKNKLKVGSSIKFSIKGTEIKAVIGQNGVFTIPKDVLTKLKIKAGDQVELDGLTSYGLVAPR
jgi:bifunctional DNA-binding transcriptional regulator/antitoxin component of YhaV-PrlF toxin-antitoxin module